MGFRQLWGIAKRQELLATAETPSDVLYTPVKPPLELGLPFSETRVHAGYLTWPKLSDLMPYRFSGVQTKRDALVVDMHLDALQSRISRYFDPNVTNDEIKHLVPEAMRVTKRYEPVETRKTLTSRGVLSSHFRRYGYRPFDLRWVYWEPETRLLGEKSPEYFAAHSPPTMQLVIPKAQRKEWSPPLLVTSLVDLNAMDGGAASVPFATKDILTGEPPPNLSTVLRASFGGDSANEIQIGLHCLAILHSPSYAHDHAETMRADVPRVPMPGDLALVAASSALGAKLAALLDPEQASIGVNRGPLRPGLRSFGQPYKRGDKTLDDADLAVTAGWGFFQVNPKTASRITQPGSGMSAERDYTAAERTALADEATEQGLSTAVALDLLGNRTVDVHLSTDVMWRNIPIGVWKYTLGGYPVIKKWLSYRERSVLGRALTPEEVSSVSELVRRIAAILLMGPALNANYEAAKANSVEWKDGRPIMNVTATG